MFSTPTEVNLEVANLLFPKECGFVPQSIQIKFEVDCVPTVTATGFLGKVQMDRLVSVLRQMPLNQMEVIKPEQE